jgi:lipopolysaccharide transport system permease protein
MFSNFSLATHDIICGIKNWRIWGLLAWQDIRLRYRRSQLGPFWISLSMAITIYSMGFLYGHLFKMDLQTYFPFLASGMLAWALISTTVNESTSAFVEAASYLRQVKLPYIVFILRVVIRNLIIFAHNIIAVIPIIFFCHVHIGLPMLSIFPGIILIALSGVVYGAILGMLGARYRDIAQVITSLMQVVFFLTPVMWMPRFLPPEYSFVVKLNPFAQYLELIRAPMTGVWPSEYTYFVTLGVTLFGIMLMLWMFSRSWHRIVYWL